jgi:hypothetical protein
MIFMQPPLHQLVDNRADQIVTTEESSDSLDGGKALGLNRAGVSAPRWQRPDPTVKFGNLDDARPARLSNHKLLAAHRRKNPRAVDADHIGSLINRNCEPQRSGSLV